MAIQFARARILSPTGATPRSAVAASAYMAREQGRDELTGERFDFRHRGSDLVDSGILLPANAPEWAADQSRLWNAATDRERVTDRATGERRWSKNGNPQVARELVLALPKELTDEQNRELALAYIASRHGGLGGQRVAVQWAIHRDPQGANPHLHLMESTRELTGRGFGKKERRLNPEFVGGRIIPDQLSGRWAEFQNAYFRERGLELRVDPTQIVAERHLGAAQHIENSEREKQNDQLREEAKEAAADPERTLAHITKRQATFTPKDVARVMKKAGIEEERRAELVEAVFSRPELVALEGGRFTTSAVIEQEQAILGAAERLSRPRPDFAASPEARAASAKAPLLDPEQRTAFDVATGAERLAIIKGRAGTGKSYTMGAIREAYEADGYRVIGLAPTNTVAADMRGDGFGEGRTIAAEMLRQQHERQVWDRRTVVVVDEMGMVSSRDLERLLVRAELTGAKVIGFGDDRQLQSVERGGLFAPLAERAPSAELVSVRRQSGWQRVASEQAARGQMRGAVNAYEQHDAVRFADTLDDSRAELVEDWRAAVEDGGAAPAVYAATNAQVQALNRDLRQVRRDLGQIGDEDHRFTVSKAGTAREIIASERDRVQFTKSVRERGTGLDLRNGEAGVIEKIEDGRRVTVRTDAGRVVTFDATEQQGWDLGYASTVYKSQGKTEEKVMALHDHAFAWRSDTAYVALTRHRDELKIYANRETVEDTAALARSLGRSNDNAPAVNFARADDRAEQVRAAVDAIRRDDPTTQVREVLAQIDAERAQEPQAESRAAEPSDPALAALARMEARKQQKARGDNERGLAALERLQQPRENTRDRDRNRDWER